MEKSYYTAMFTNPIELANYLKANINCPLKREQLMYAATRPFMVKRFGAYVIIYDKKYQKNNKVIKVKGFSTPVILN